MTRDGLPRAYLRVDPNLDHTHPDVDGFMRLLCAAARQPERGRFKDRSLLDRALGRAKARKAMERGDIVTLTDGRLYVDGWDEWQEGDHTVADRMRRMREKRRAKRNGDTRPPSPGRTDVTTDAGDTNVEKDALGVGVGVLPPNPPPSGGRRSQGTNPRAVAARLEEERREHRRHIHRRYLNGEISELEERRLYADLDRRFQQTGEWDEAWGDPPKREAS